MAARKKRIVVKIGTSVLTRSAAQGGRDFNVPRDSALGALVHQVCALKDQGVETILVTSGAIGAGLVKLGLSKRPEDIPRKQAAAAIGQVSLMQAYEQLFKSHGALVAQVLLTRSDFEDRRRYLNARNTLSALLELDVTPVINENDTVAVEEIKFGDNDRLSAMVAAKMDADRLLILSDVEGLYRGWGTKDKALLSMVPSITREVEQMAGADTNEVGTGGMASKIEAAKIAVASGVTTVIASAFRANVVADAAAGLDVGTRFPALPSLTAKERWILFGALPKGDLVVDDGAAKALRELRKSLLPAGVSEVRGTFRKGDVVRVVTREGMELGRGISAFSAADADKIKGHKSSDIRRLLGAPGAASEVVHRDQLVLLP